MTGSDVRSGLILGSGLLAGWITCTVIIIQNMGAF
jgi:hypothetical protein